LLVSVNVQVRAQQLIQWVGWHANVRPYFLLLGQSLPKSEVDTGFDEATWRRSLPVLAHTCLTALRLQQAKQEWAEPARRVLAQLTGQNLETAQQVPNQVLQEGLGKLYVLLDAMETGDTTFLPAAQQPASGETRHGLWNK
jgi:flagellar biosynthesis protein FlhF